MNTEMQPRDGAPPGVSPKPTEPWEKALYAAPKDASAWWPVASHAGAFGVDAGRLAEGLGWLSDACGGLKVADLRAVGGWLEVTLTGPRGRVSLELGEVDWGPGDFLEGPVMGPQLGEVWAKLRAGDRQGEVTRRAALASELVGQVATGAGLQEAFTLSFQRQEKTLGTPERTQEALVGLGHTLRALAPLVPVVDAIASGAGPSAWEGLPKALRQAVAQ